MIMLVRFGMIAQMVKLVITNTLITQQPGNGQEYDKKGPEHHRASTEVLAKGTARGPPLIPPYAQFNNSYIERCLR